MENSRQASSRESVGPQDLLAQALAAHRAGNVAAAMAGYRQVLRAAPQTAAALANLGSLLRQRGELAAGLRLLEQALVAPGSDEHAAFNLGNAYRAAGRRQEAVLAYRQAIARRPDWALAHCNLGVALLEAGEEQEAEAVLRQALALDPAHALAHENLGRLLSSRLMRRQYLPGEEAGLRALAAEYGRLCPAADLPVVLFPGPAERGAPLRIGFLSPDLCEHPVGFFLRPLLQRLDRQRLEPILYSSGGRNDAVRRDLRRLGQWADVAGFDDARLLARLRGDGLDVLIDLSGHTAGHRLPVFARRAAPLQLSWLGYFATTGVPAMDGVLMDGWHVPPGADGLFAERVLRLPGSRFCYQAPAYAPAVSPPPCERNGYPTFGSFNNTAKYHPGVFDLWARLLGRVADARLILKWRDLEDAACRRQVEEAFRLRAIDPRRIELRPFSVHRELLGQYADLDIALDPFPFSGGHTSCEALWMGVPVVTWPGPRPVSRQTLSFLANLNRGEWLRDWVAGDADDYLRKAAALAQAPERLTTIRRQLRPTMQASPLMDKERFAREFATAIESAWASLSGAAKANPF